MAKVILDAGHGGNILGSIYNGRYEKNDNLNLALEVGKILSENGVEVNYTRTSDVYLSPIERIEKANQEGADLFVALHRADSPFPDALTGVRASVYKEEGLAEEASENILENLVAIGFNSFEIRLVQDYVILSNANMPALMLDVGFINSSYDNEIFDTRFHDIAKAIASGILDTLGIQNIKTTRWMEDNRRILDPLGPRYRVQVDIFRAYNDALNLQNQLLQLKFSAEIVPQRGYYAIHVGDYSSLDEAVWLERILRFEGYNTLLIAL